MEREATSMQTLCRGGCGFYGSPATDGLCSVCFKEALKKKQQQPNTQSNLISQPLSIIDESGPAKSCEERGSQSNSDSGDPDKGESINPAKKNRCFTCRRKVGLTGFECRCGGVYCGTHRYTDEHSCTFDYRTLGADEIRRNNPVVAGEKVKKI